MSEIGRFMVLAGVAVALLGAVVWLLGRMGFRGMPGDIRYESGNTKVYFPIVTCIVLSLLLTLVIWLWQWLSRK